MKKLVFLYLLTIAHIFFAKEAITMKVYSVDSPPTQGENPFYIGNRLPLLPNPLIKLPLGSVEPRGWLRHQLLLMANGLCGHLDEISPWCKFEGSAWASPTGEGERGWEELPYWLKGYIDLGYILKEERIINKAKRWVEAVLASQEADGYFGPRDNKRNNDLWPNMIMLYVLRSFYEATGDKRVLPFMSKYFHWQFSQPPENLLPGSWQKWRGGDNLDSIYWLYNRTGESWLLDLARIIHERTADWTNGIPTWHGVNICQGFREPAQFYQQSKDPKHLEATERNYRTVMEIYGQVPGGMFGADENCRPGYTDPRQAAETCSMVEFMFSDEILLSITGNPIYADRCEEIAFNSLPPAFTPDLKALHYLTAPNMIQLDSKDHSPLIQNGGEMLSYNPYAYRCCQHNHSHGWPYFSEHLWMATRDKGLAGVLYAPSKVSAKVGDGREIQIIEETDYPFDENIKLTILTQKEVQFPLYLRVPGWCESPKVILNGKELKVEAKPRSYIVIDRVWQNGDEIELVLPMKIKVRVWEKNKNSVSVDRGPLTYSLRIEEKWVRYGGTDEWPAYEVYPTTPWNYALLVDLNDPENSFRVVKRDGALPYQPFSLEGAPIELIGKGRRLPQWQEERGMVGLLPNSPVHSPEPLEEIRLIPMGCARLRISAFPMLEE
ncbi:glycoside hydrolase family 127 protein [bacterium]|nr:glycoside hydrolase family 127 protein [bacterium]